VAAILFFIVLGYLYRDFQLRPRVVIEPIEEEGDMEEEEEIEEELNEPDDPWDEVDVPDLPDEEDDGYFALTLAQIADLDEEDDANNFGYMPI